MVSDEAVDPRDQQRNRLREVHSLSHDTDSRLGFGWQSH
jgi:hypothetical protein